MGGDTLRAAAGLLTRPGAIRSAAAPALASELGGSGITRRRERDVFARLAQQIADGALEPVIGATFDFDRAPEAYALVEGGHATGKVVITRAQV